VATDEVLRAISLMIHNAVREVGSSSDFVGQFSPTEIVLVTQPSILPGLTERIESRLEQSLDYFYPLKDRDRKDFLGKRLAVWMNRLTADQGPFQNLEALKSRLAGQH
jgi:hypothetical protein